MRTVAVFISGLTALALALGCGDPSVEAKSAAAYRSGVGFDCINDWSGAYNQRQTSWRCERAADAALAAYMECRLDDTSEGVCEARGERVAKRIAFEDDWPGRW